MRTPTAVSSFGSARIAYSRVSELEAKMFTKNLVAYENLGLDGEADAQLISSVTTGLVFAGAAGGALVIQELPGPDIIRWSLSASLICSPYAFLSLGLATPRFLQGGVARVRSIVSPEYRERMLRHEAGHFLVGHLVGLPVASYSAAAAESAVEVALNDGTRAGTREHGGEAGPAEDPEELLNALAIVSLAGVVAECLCFGKAEGGLADLSQLQQFQDSLLPRAAMAAADNKEERKRQRRRRDEDQRNRVRWAAVQAYLLLHENGALFERLVQAMGRNASPEECICAMNAPGDDQAGLARGPGTGELGGTQPWSFCAADGSWPVERTQAGRMSRAKEEREALAGGTGSELRAAVGKARDLVTRDPSLSAAVVAMLGATALVVEAVAKGQPLH